MYALTRRLLLASFFVLGAQCGSDDSDDPCEGRYDDGVCEEGCQHRDRDCDTVHGLDPTGDACLDAGRYQDSVCDACPRPDPMCAALSSDTCMNEARYGDGSCDACRTFDPDCDTTGTIDPCLDPNLYGDGTCDACSHYDPDCHALSASDPCDEGMTYYDGVCDACANYDFDCDPGTYTAPRVRDARATDGTHDNFVRVTWSHLTASTRYFVRRSSHPIDNFERTHHGQDAAGDGTQLWDDQDVATGEGYYYRVETFSLYDQIASGFNNGEPPADFGFAGAINDTGTAPPSPSGVEVHNNPPGTRLSAGSADFLLVLWDFESTATSYTVMRRAQGEADFSQVSTVTPTDGWSGPLFLDEDVLSGVEYEYQIVATNSGGSSAPSATVSDHIRGVDAPMNLFGTQTAPDSVQLSWDVVPMATSYEVFRATQSDGELTLAATVATNTALDQGFTMPTPGNEEMLWYRVQAIGPFGRSELSYERAVAVYAPMPPLSAPANLVVDVVRARSLQISWDDNPLAGVHVVALQAPGGAFEEIWTGQGSVYTASALTPATAYEVRVSAMNYDEIPGLPATVSAVTLLPAAENFLLDGTPVGIALSWDAVAGAASYDVTRWVGDWCGGTGTLVGHVTELSLSDIPPSEHYGYAYGVTAVDASGRAGEAGVCLSGYQPLSAPSNMSIARENLNNRIGMRITWDSVCSTCNNLSYQLFKSADVAGPFTAFATTSQSTYLATDASPAQLAPKTTYYFYVEAKWGNYNGESGITVSEMTTVAIPVLTATTTLFDAVDLSWSAIDGAAYYTLHRTDDSNPTTGAYSEVATGLTGTTYQDLEIPMDMSNSGELPRTSYYKLEAFTGDLGAAGDLGSGQSFWAPGKAKAVMLVPRVSASSEATLSRTCSSPSDCGPGQTCGAASKCSISAYADRVVVNWDYNDDASKFRILRAFDPAGPFTALADVVPETDVTCDLARDFCSYNDMSVNTSLSGMVYIYRVHGLGPHDREGPGQSWSTGYVWSGSHSLLSPSTVSASASAGGNTVIWGSVTGADDYRIFRRMNGSSLCIADPLLCVLDRYAFDASSPFVDANVVAGETYEYTVYSMQNGQQTNDFGALSNAVVAQ